MVEFGEELPPWSLFERDGYATLRSVLPRDYVISTLLPRASESFRRCFHVMHRNNHVALPSPLVMNAPTNANSPTNTNANGKKKYLGSRYTLGLGARNGFKEIVRRNGSRYEVRMGTQSAPFTDPLVTNCAPLHGALKRIFGGEDYYMLGCSVVVSLADEGSREDQQWHVDGGHLSAHAHLPCHCLNVFIPLVDMTMDLGPTEIRPGTHVHSRSLSKMMLSAMARKTLRKPVCPIVTAGSCVMFDYRVLHRGRANLSADTDRPVLVLTYAKTFFKDVFNFPARSLFDKSFKVAILSKAGRLSYADFAEFAKREAAVDAADDDVSFDEGEMTHLVCWLDRGSVDPRVARSLLSLKRQAPDRFFWGFFRDDCKRRLNVETESDGDDYRDEIGNSREYDREEFLSLSLEVVNVKGCLVRNASREQATAEADRDDPDPEDGPTLSDEEMSWMAEMNASRLFEFNNGLSKGCTRVSTGRKGVSSMYRFDVSPLDELVAGDKWTKIDGEKGTRIVFLDATCNKK